MTTEITTPKTGVRYFTTKRERREAKRAIAKHMKQGMKQKDIATLMGVPHSTVMYHASHPMPVKHRTEATARAPKEVDDQAMMVVLVPIARAVFRSPAITAEQVTAFLTMVFLAAQNT